MKKYLLLLIFPLLMVACKKDKPAVIPATPSEYFMPLKTGSWWVYRRDTDDPNFTNPISRDTMRITRDTLIDGLRFYEIKGGSLASVQDFLYADSAGFIIRADHYPFLFTVTANDTILKDTTDGGFDYRVYHSGNIDTSITVPAGNFSCSEMVLDFYYLTGPPPPPSTNPRQQLQYFSKGVGLVKCKTFYASDPANLISVLESYHIAQ